MRLKELSEILGLSQTTVSRALNGYPEVSETTRERVVRAARKFNYSPNSSAKRLATGRAMMIGHVIPASAQHEMINPIFGDFVAGASAGLADEGYDMMISRVADEDQENAYRRLITRGAIDGLIVQGPKMNDPRIAMLNAMEVPYVVHGRATGVTAPYSWVDVNNKRSFLRATDFLLDLGHRRIALVNGLEEMDFADRRRQGYCEALSARGIAPDPMLMHSEEMTEAYGYRTATHLLQLPDPPTAILTSAMIPAIGVRRAIAHQGLVMGRDVSVITHDDNLSYLRNGDEVPIFTATRSSVRLAGEIAAAMLIDIITDAVAQPITRLLEAELVVGGSTGPALQRT
ncbi:MAG: substrate-binding domain-containing protein [Pseudomonadota bacterium]